MCGDKQWQTTPKETSYYNIEITSPLTKASNVKLGYSLRHTVYPKKYAHGFVVLCFVMVMQSFLMNSFEVFIHIHQGCYAGTGAIVRLPQCQWSKPDGYGKISQCITTTKHSKAKTVCIFLGIYCSLHNLLNLQSSNKQVIWDAETIIWHHYNGKKTCAHPTCWQIVSRTQSDTFNYIRKK